MNGSGIIIDGFEEFEELLEDMVLSDLDKRKAVKSGIEKVADKIEKYSPVGKTGKLKKIKIRVKNTGLAVEATANSEALYDVFQEFGTSEQKENVGYFEKAVKESTDEALEAMSEIIFKNLR